MKIDSLDQQSLMNLHPERLETRMAAAPAQGAQAADQTQLGLGAELAGLGEAHTLDADRVAALIADPFGDE